MNVTALLCALLVCASGLEIRLCRKTAMSARRVVGHVPSRRQLPPGIRRQLPPDIPLNPQGAYDWPNETSFVMGVQVGSQSARFNVLVDTGSGDFGIARVGCATCKEQSLWQPASAVAVACVSATHNCSHCVGEQCAVKIGYGDGSGWVGVLYKDTVTLDGGPTVKGVTIAAMINVSSTLHPFGSSETDGILGLSRDGLPTIMDALLAQDATCAPHFSLCGDAISGNGLLTLCAFGNHHTGPINWAPMVGASYGGYAIALTGLAIGSKKFALTENYVLVDSGTPRIMIDDYDVFEGFIAELRVSAPANFSTSGDCFPLADDVAAKFPTLQILTSTFAIVLPPNAYFEPCGAQRRRLAVDSGSMTVLGLPAFYANEVLFDLAANRIGFAPVHGCAKE